MSILTKIQLREYEKWMTEILLGGNVIFEMGNVGDQLFLHAAFGWLAVSSWLWANLHTSDLYKQKYYGAMMFMFGFFAQ